MKIGAFRRVGAVGRRFAALENAEKEARPRLGELSHWLSKAFCVSFVAKVSKCAFDRRERQRISILFKRKTIWGAGKNALRNDKPPGDASGVVK